MSKKTALIIAASLIIAQIFAQSRPDALRLYRERNYRQAITVCEAELRQNPNNLDSHVVLCWSLVGNRQYREAETRATAARRIAPTDIRLMEVLGEAKYYLGKNNEALALFQMYVANSTETAPRLGTVYYYMGEIFIRQQKYEHADISFSAAVQYEPSYSAYWWTRLGYAREMTQDWRNAIAAYDRALALNASYRDATLGKNRCQEHLNS